MMFSILHLPREIRQLIYVQVFQFDQEDVIPSTEPPPGGNRLALIFTCRAILYECRDLALRNTVCRIRNFSINSFDSVAYSNFIRFLEDKPHPISVDYYTALQRGAEIRAYVKSLQSQILQLTIFTSSNIDLSPVKYLSISGSALEAIFSPTDVDSVVLTKLTSALCSVTHAVFRHHRVIYPAATVATAEAFSQIQVVIAVDEKEDRQICTDLGAEHKHFFVGMVTKGCVISSRKYNGVKNITTLCDRVSWSAGPDQTWRLGNEFVSGCIEIYKKKGGGNIEGHVVNMKDVERRYVHIWYAGEEFARDLLIKKWQNILPWAA